MKAVKKVLSIILIILIVLALLFVCISVGEKIVFAKFFSNAQKEFKIPGLFTGYTPQGFDYLENEKTFLLTGYDKDNESPSMVYKVNEETEKAEKVLLYNKDGSNYTSHVGGICHYNEWVYIAHGSGVDMFKLSDILDGDGNASVVDRISVENIELGVACCNVYDGALYVAEFYIAEDYETPDSHRMKTPAGDDNMAIMASYTLGEDGKPISETPDAIFSIRGMVQGMCLVNDGRIALSTSYGLAKSRTYIYDAEKIFKQENGTVTINGISAPIYYIDSSCLDEEIVSSPMAEEIVYKDGRLYILTESACMKYVFGKILSGNYVYSYKLA
ncbi:MAG: hypothetical protein IJZ93_01210 [Clostridia bacterium]|nr:hypothetical protein [Clostridia bacterium]